MSELLPNNTEIERNIVGQALADGRIPTPALRLLPSDFYNNLWADVWTVLLELNEQNQILDVYAVSQKVKGEYPRSSGTSAAEIALCGNGLPMGRDVAQQVETLKELSALRFLIKGLTSASVAAQSLEDSNAVTMQVEALLNVYRNSFGSPQGHFVSIQEIVDTQLIRALRDMQSGVSYKIPTGFHCIDDLSGGGISPKDIWLIAALTGGGKSSLALMVARSMAKNGYPVAFVSREMSNLENGLRMLAQFSGFSMSNFRPGLSSTDYDFLIDWLGEMRTLPIYFDETTSDMANLRIAIKSLVAEKGIKVLFVDYLQLLSAGKTDVKLSTRTEEVAYISRELKDIAKKENLAIVALVQFNRNAAYSGEPELHHIKEAGQIEQDTSFAWFIDLDKANPEDWRAPRRGKFRIAKGRNVPQTEINVLYHGSKLTFEEGF